jgi:hypothetical protein
MSVEERIKQILSPAIDTNAPYAKQVIAALNNLIAEQLVAESKEPFKVTAHPTEELTEIKINGHMTPCRIWGAETEKGTLLEMYVLSVVPLESYRDQWDRERPDFMKPTRVLAAIGDSPKEGT